MKYLSMLKSTEYPMAVSSYGSGLFGATPAGGQKVGLFRQIVRGGKLRWQYVGEVTWDDHHGFYHMPFNIPGAVVSALEDAVRTLFAEGTPRKAMTSLSDNVVPRIEKVKRTRQPRKSSEPNVTPLKHYKIELNLLTPERAHVMHEYFVSARGVTDAVRIAQAKIPPDHRLFSVGRAIEQP